MVDDLKRIDEWQRITKEEEKRKKGLEELQRFIESGVKEGKSARDLLRLIVRVGRLKVSDASNLLSVNRDSINHWIRILLSKGIIDIENPKLSDPAISLSQSFRERIRHLEKKRGEEIKHTQSPEEVSELLRKKQELIEEHEGRLEISEELEKKNQELIEKEKEREFERQKRKELEEKLDFVKKQITEQTGDENLNRVKEQLTREHQERLKIEATLQREHEALSKIQKDYRGKYDALLKDEDELKRKREKLKEDVEKLMEKEKDLENLLDAELSIGGKEIVKGFGEELRKMERDVEEFLGEKITLEESVEEVPKAEIEPEIKEPESVREPEKIEIERVEESKKIQPIDASKVEAMPEKEPVKGKLLIEKILEEPVSKEGKKIEKKIEVKEEIPKPSLELEEEKNANSLFELIKKSGRIKLSEAIGRLDMDKGTIEGWIKELSSEGLIEVRSGFFGSKELVFKRDRTTKITEADLIREELRKIREDELKKR